MLCIVDAGIKTSVPISGWSSSVDWNLLTAVNVATQHIFRCWPGLFYFYPMDGGMATLMCCDNTFKTSVKSF